MKIKSSFSFKNEMSSYRSGAPETAAVVAENTGLNRDVTHDEVKAAILKYAEARQNEGSRQVATMLTTATINFSDNIATLIIHNETQREKFLLFKQDLVDGIRADLKNNSIGIEVEISKTEVQTKAYKPVDVFKAMTEKNPALLELKKRFDLEIDY